jgi:hypothetical protein
MVKHMLNISDEDTMQMIRENLYIQYFLGFDSFLIKIPLRFVTVRRDSEKKGS